MSRVVLIVDDNATNRAILHKILGDEYEILEAINGVKAHEVLLRDGVRISAVILDIVMPLLDGYGLLSLMKENPKLAQIPVIMNNSSADAEAEMKALSMGANDFMTKPYNPGIIKRRLKNMINLRETAATINALQKDSLTGLLNRDAFFERAGEMIKAHPASYYVMSCFDINKFKVINDQYGNARGDSVLKSIAVILEHELSLLGGVCCRISADNFAMLYPADFMNSPDIDAIHEKISDIGKTVMPISFCVGRYIVSDRTLPVSAMYDRSAMATESIKGLFGERVALYNESMREGILKEQAIVNDMKTALESRQYVIWLQPQYNHSTGALIGAEALVRWKHPEKGMISPGEFIPVFERNGFIYELDKYVWETTCALLRKWLDEGVDTLPVSVNISRFDLFRDDLTDVIENLVKKYGVPTSLLRLEITESAFAKSAERIINMVTKFISMGFTVEIDDFGSGYSSLNTLKDVPAQIIKLDMRFLEGKENTQRGGSIVESVVRMSKWLGLSVIAEGVEAVEQADYLKTIGCSYVQGYLYARPMPVSEYEKLLKSARREVKLISNEPVENLDNNTFWDPKSMDTLVFNNYVGGACIIEYNEGEMELLRANEKFARVLGGEGMSVEDALRFIWKNHMDAGAYSGIKSAVLRAIDEKDAVACDADIKNLSVGHAYLRLTMRAIAAAGSRHLIYCSIENLTAQHDAEKNERLAGQRLQVLMESAGSGIMAACVRGERREILFANEKFYELSGYGREEFEAAFPDRIGPVNPRDMENVLGEITELTKNGGKRTLEYRLRRKSGEEIWLRQRITCTTSDEGQVLLSIMDNISEERRAESQSGETSSQMSAIMSAIDDGISVTSADLLDAACQYANDRYFELLGYTRAQFAAEQPGGISAIMYPEDIERVKNQVRRTTEMGLPFSVDFRARKRNGEHIYLRAAGSVRRVGSRDVLITALRDVTRETEAARRAGALVGGMTDIMGEAPCGYMKSRINADGMYTVERANDVLCGMLGLSQAEIRNNFPERVHIDDVPLLAGVRRDALNGDGRMTAAFRLRGGDGEYVKVSMTGRIDRDANGAYIQNMYYAIN